jgi:hypothetical protein
MHVAKPHSLQLVLGSSLNISIVLPGSDKIVSFPPQPAHQNIDCAMARHFNGCRPFACEDAGLVINI